MRYGHVQSCALYGIQGILVDIEVTILPGLPSFAIVGLGDSAVQESRNRVHAAIKNSGFDFPASRITACYAPAWLRKEGSAFDLPLALAILIASGQAPVPADHVCAFGELSLQGEVRSIPGAICRVAACQENKLGRALVPNGNFTEIVSAGFMDWQPVKSLKEAVAMLDPGMASIVRTDRNTGTPNFDITAIANCRPIHEIGSIVGQTKAVRALQIAAAGRHNLLLLGSPGCGKTSLASVLPALLPPLEPAEALMVTRIYSASGLLKDGEGLICRRPFRALYHSVTRAALVGGGSIPLPGEISLAHQGVLFLDEMTEFMPETLDLLRQPIEDKVVRLVRLRHNITYPADFMLVGAANPCRCGEYLEPTAKCRCTAESVRQHLNRLSGPLIDRMDLTVEMTRLSAAELEQSVRPQKHAATRTAAIAETIRKSWEIQQRRCQLAKQPFQANGRIVSANLTEIFAIPDQVAGFVAQTAAKFNLSARGYQRILRIARTIADLDGSEHVSIDHVSEALQFRMRWLG